MRLKVFAVAAALLSTCLHTARAEDASCRTVRFADVGWSDIAATTGLASMVLEGLGYETDVTLASLPVALTGMKNKQIDVFLGYWKPAMTAVVEPFVKAGNITVIEQPNLVGAKYTLAVPQYLYDKGLKTFADIAKFEKALRGKIHGIEAGSDSNALIAGMIRDNQFGLKNFTLVESSEAGMLALAHGAIIGKKPIVFLGWEPHPMNVQMKMHYLSGGDEVFGPNLGEAQVYTATAAGYAARCPNVAELLKNLQFSTDLENQVMGPVLEKTKPKLVARNFLKRNPAVLGPWLRDVKTFDGMDGLPEVLAALKR